MSFLNKVMKFINSSATRSAICPVCRHKSLYPASKIREEKTLLCPVCKSLFVVIP